MQVTIEALLSSILIRQATAVSVCQQGEENSLVNSLELVNHTEAFKNLALGIQALSSSQIIKISPSEINALIGKAIIQSSYQNS